MNRIACKVIVACILLNFTFEYAVAVHAHEAAQTASTIPAVSYDVVYDWKSQRIPGSAYWLAMAVSSDGTRIAASQDDEASWSMASRRKVLRAAKPAAGQNNTYTGAAVYTSADSGLTWRTALKGRFVALASSSDGTRLLAAQSEGYIYTSADSGATWTARTSAGERYWGQVSSSSDGMRLVAVGTDADYPSPGYIYTSADSGATWTARTGAGKRYWGQVASSSDGTRIVAAGSDFNGYPGYLYTSSDSGATWSARAGTRSWGPFTLSPDGTRIVAAINEGIYTSDDSGATWTQRTSPANYTWTAVASSSDGSTIIATGSPPYNQSEAYFFTSNDSGDTWTQQFGTSSILCWNAVASSADGTRLFAAEYFGLIYASSDSGSSWTRVPAPSQSYNSVASSSDGTKLFAAQSGLAPGYIYASANSGATWKPLASAGRNAWGAIASSSDGKTLIASGYLGISFDTVLCTSTDSGATWKKQTRKNSGWTAVACSSNGTRLAAVTDNGYIFTSKQSGTTWSSRNFPGCSFTSIVMSSDGTRLAAVDGSNGYIYTSADTGATWTQQTGAGKGGVLAASSDGTRLVLADTDIGYIYTSTDSGATWTEQTGLGRRRWGSLASSADGTRLAATDTGDDPDEVIPGYINVSDDSGKSWTPQMNAGYSAATLWMSPDGSKIIAGTDLFSIGSASAASPYITSPSASSVAETSAILGATIGYGAPPLTAAGIAYGPDIKPDITGGTVPTEATSGPFTVDASGLTSNTLYFFRGYLTSSTGAVYGQTGTFTTVPDPPIATAATNICSTTLADWSTGFTANWTAPTGTADIAEYRLDLSTDPDSVLSSTTTMIVRFKSTAVIRFQMSAWTSVVSTATRLITTGSVWSMRAGPATTPTR